MRTLVLAVMTAVFAAAPAAVPAAEQDDKAKADGDRRESRRQLYDFDRFLDEEHPFPGTYATPSRDSAARPHLPSRPIGEGGGKNREAPSGHGDDAEATRQQARSTLDTPRPDR